MVLMFLAEIDSELQLLDADISLIKVYCLENCCYRTQVRFRAQYTCT